MNGKSISGMFEKLSSGTKAQLQQWLKFRPLGCAKDAIPIPVPVHPEVAKIKDTLVSAGEKVAEKANPSADTIIFKTAEIEQKPKVVGPKGKVIIPDVVAQRKADSLDTALIPLDKNAEQIDSSKTITLQEAIKKHSSKSDSIRPKGKVIIPEVVAQRKNYDIGTSSEKLGE